MSTYSQILSQVKINCANRDDDEFVASVMFNTNMILTWLATQAEWQELQTKVSTALVISKQEYTKAELAIPNVRKIYSIRLKRSNVWSRPLQYVTPEMLDRGYSGVVVNGYPESYTYFGEKYKFNCPAIEPFPCEIKILTKPTLVTNLDSNIPFEDLDGPLTCLVSGFGWLGTGDGSVADKWFKAGGDQLSQLGIDVTTLVNFKAHSNVRANSGQPWADPFRRS